MSACDKALNYAKNKRIDECESVFSKRKVTTIRITDSAIAEIKQNHEKLLGVRIIHQKKISSAQTSDPDDAEGIVQKALELSSLVKTKNYWVALPTQLKYYKKIEKLFDKKLADISGTEAVDIAQSMINAGKKSKVSNISGSLNIVYEEFNIANTNGLECTDYATYISGTINADSDFGNIPVSGIGQESCRMRDSFVPEKIGDDAAEMCVGSINPQTCQDDTYSLIFEPYSVGELLSFVTASNFSLKLFSEKRSCFSNKLEENIAVENVNLIDDPHAPDGIGSKGFDDEGVKTKQNFLIENGVFKNLYSDLLNSFKENKTSSGNASRPGSPMGRRAQPIPIPAPHNLRLIGNTSSFNDMIKDTKHGLIVGRLWYTYPVNPIKGDFSCTARSGVRIIENGEIKNAGKPVRIVHNLVSLLNNVSAIGDDEKNVLQWASLPSIAPSCKVEKVKVISI